MLTLTERSLLGLILFAAAAPLTAQPTPSFPQSVASGDPLPDSVVVWTRVVDAALAGTDLPVTLELAATPDFSPVLVQRTELLARTVHDGCVKVRVNGLQPGTHYWYRFTYGASRSAIGRTKTAPAPHQSPAVRFAFLNCQDYVGRYYNTLSHLVTHEPDNLDFVVYLGDYVYETTGDPSFQTTGGTRQIEFADEAGAIELGSAEAPYFAAASLDNYRQLYRTYRSDRLLQRVHELFPVIAIWDDHEYSNDHWQETATYFDGRQVEASVSRKRNAEQAFYEYLPIDVGLDDRGVQVDDTVLFPNTRIYRDFQFGQRLHLLVTDFRTYRPDHLVAEDAFPGEVVLDEATASAMLGAGWASARASFDPYVDVDEPAHAALKAGLVQIATGAYLVEGLDATTAAARATQAVKGNLSAAYLNGLFQAAGQPVPLPPEFVATLPRGLSYLLLGKQALFSSFGSRYLVPRPTYQLYAAYRAMQNAASQDAYGPAQSAWLASTLGASTAQWKVVGSSVSFAPLVFDFANPPLPLPPEFPLELRTQLQLNADDWDGFPNGRQAVVDLLAQHNAAIISGDIHASFVSRHVATSGRTVPEFTGTSVSSETFREELQSEVNDNPALDDLPGVEQLLAATDFLLRDASTRLPESDLLSSVTDANGYVIMEAGPDLLQAVYRHLPGTWVEQDLTALANAGRLDAAMSESRYAATASTGGGLAVAELPSTAANFRLQLLHASDLEGGVDAIEDAPNFAAIVDRFTQTDLPTLILGAGDGYIPGPFFSAAGDPALRGPLDAVTEAYTGVSGLDIREAAGRADITIMNLIGFDASALGNHEFDAGTPVLRELLGTDIRGTTPGTVRWLGTQFPYLSANLDFTPDSNLAPIYTPVGTLPTTSFQSRADDLVNASKAPKLAPSAIVIRNGHKIGIVGATTPLLAQISSPGATAVKHPGAGSNDMPKLAAILQPVIDALRADGANKIVLVTHLQQLALEQELVPLLRGVDLCVAGGSDSILANSGTPLRAGDTAVGPYPIVTQNAEGEPALIVSTDGQYKYVGRLVVEFDAAGKVLPASIDTGASGPWKTDAEGVQAVWGEPTPAFAPGTRGGLVKQVTDAVLGVVTAKDANILARPVSSSKADAWPSALNRPTSAISRPTPISRWPGPTTRPRPSRSRMVVASAPRSESWTVTLANSSPRQQTLSPASRPANSPNLMSRTRCASTTPSPC